MALTDIYAPKVGTTTFIVSAVIIIVMILYTRVALKRGSKYKKVIMRYAAAGSIDAIPASVMTQLSILKGLDLADIGTWITMTYGALGFYMLIAMSN